MARIQPSLSRGESELIDRVAALTQTKRTDVIKNALSVYYWYVKQRIIGARVTARRPGGEEVMLETPELGILDSSAGRLTPEEIGTLSRQLAACTDPVQAERLREQITRGFYGF